MPFSVRENDDFVVDIVKRKIKPHSVLDVGPGSGTYGNLLRPHLRRAHFDAVEVWEPYIEAFNLRRTYDRVFVEDIRDWTNFDYDLVIFGDVLEHMTFRDAKSVWERASLRATWGMISVPIIYYPQGDYEDNPFEVHVQDRLTPEFIADEFGPFDEVEIFPITGTFFRKFN